MKNINLTKLGLAVVLLAGVSAYANAQEEVLTPVEEFIQIDADSNGQLTQAEVAESGNALLEAEFDAIDSDDDSEISMAELTQYLANN